MVVHVLWAVCGCGRWNVRLSDGMVVVGVSGRRGVFHALYVRRQIRFVCPSSFYTTTTLFDLNNRQSIRRRRPTMTAINDDNPAAKEVEVEVEDEDVDGGENGVDDDDDDDNDGEGAPVGDASKKKKKKSEFRHIM